MTRHMTGGAMSTETLRANVAPLEIITGLVVLLPPLFPPLRPLPPHPRSPMCYMPFRMHKLVHFKHLVVAAPPAPAPCPLSVSLK